MSFPIVKKSIFALQLLGAATIASFVGFSAPASTTLSQIERQFDAGREVAYRGTGRIDNGVSVAYRASGRFNSEVDGALAYRGSERGLEAVTDSAFEVIAYRASGRFGVEADQNIASRSHDESAVEVIAYRASGRFGTDSENRIVYRGSERGIDNSLIA